MRFISARVERLVVACKLFTRDDGAGAANHNDKADQCSRRPEI
jgi:hypothetical protein